MKVRSFIAYGVLLAESIDLGDNEDDYTSYIATKYHLKRPKGVFKGNEEEWRKYWKEKDSLIKRLNVSIEPYGPLPDYKEVLVARDSIEYCIDDYETPLTNFIVDKAWNKQIEQVALKCDLKTSSETKWWLLNSWTP